MAIIINGRGRVGVRPPSGGGGGYGTLTTSWIAATGETDATILGALNTLETNLDTYGLKSKMKALYPFVGGTAGKHSYNFMNTAQYQITWAGGITHSSTGVLFNGTNSYGDTNLNVNSVMTLNSTAFGIYNRTDSAAATRAHGVAQGGNYAVLFDKWTGNRTYLYLNDNGFTGVDTANTDAKGFYQGSRTASNALRLVKNTTHTTSTAVSSAKPNGNFLLGHKII